MLETVFLFNGDGGAKNRERAKFIFNPFTPVLISVGRNEEDGATRLTVQKVQFNSVLAFLSLSEELLSHKKSTGRHAEVTLGQQVEAIISEVQSMLVAREVFFLWW